ncbi:MAG: disulfide bond formation protein B [Gammaproteobacteria bacterium]|nr:disulfide bond formation protein B [Gammaproteobacteria bacterium]
MNYQTNRKRLLFGAMLCFTSLAIAYFYFQQYVGLPPCPLCILDRIIIGSLGVIFLLLAFGNLVIIKLLGLVAVAAGLAVGGRHVWLERVGHSDSSSAACAPGGAQDVIEWVTAAFIGVSDCSVVYWSIWGFSIADLTLALYVVLAFIFFSSWRRRAPRRNIFS